MFAIGRANANEMAGEIIQHFPVKDKDVEAKAAVFLDTKIEPRAPLFNLVSTISLFVLIPLTFLLGRRR